MDEELQKILAASSVSTEMTAKTFFPERFYVPFAKNIHGKIFDLIDGPANKVAIAAPRGWGKTSIVALALMARYILFRHTGFICYINKSHDAASLQTENLRRELVTNRMIRAFFGDFKARRLAKAKKTVKKRRMPYCIQLTLNMKKKVSQRQKNLRLY